MTSPTAPPVLESARGTLVRIVAPGGELAEGLRWMRLHYAALRDLLAAHGYLLLRGLDLTSTEDFAAIRNAFIREPMTQRREETSPRTQLGDGVYSSTDLPAAQRIRLHNEDSYSVTVPGVVMFGCLTAAEQGGATTIADVRQVLRAIPPEIVDEFRRRGWLVVRNYYDHFGMPWPEAIGTADRDEAALYCEENVMGLQWRPDGGLRTTAVRPATLMHPGTGQEVWFNHVAVFNLWTHDEQTGEVLLETFGEDGLPQNTYFGDGARIPRGHIDAINHAYDRATIAQEWTPGDVLIVDNLLCAHGREPYRGSRRVLVAMGEPCQVTLCSPTTEPAPYPRAGR